MAYPVFVKGYEKFKAKKEININTDMWSKLKVAFGLNIMLKIVEADWPSFLKKLVFFFKLEMKWLLFLCHILLLDFVRPVSSFYYDYDYYFLHSDYMSNQESSDTYNIPQRFWCNLHVYF